MSKFSMEYLHENQRVGFGRVAWWFSEQIEKALAIPSHYASAVPLAEVRRLFSTVAVTSGEMFTTYTDAAGNKQSIHDESRQVILNAITGDVFGVFKRGSAWPDHNRLTDNVSALVGGIGDLGVQTAGLLDNGARAYVSVGVSDEMHNDEAGLTFRPNLIACQALDGTLAETYMRTVTVPLCDNTLSACLSENGERFKIKHTKNAGLKVKDAQEALALLSQTADEFSEQITELCRIDVSDAVWSAFLDAAVPLPEAKDPLKPGRGYTMAERKRETLGALWANDPRVSPWKGTAFGVVQAVNTYGQHLAIRRGADDGDITALRAERNLSDTLAGKIAASDTGTVDTLFSVLASV